MPTILKQLTSEDVKLFLNDFPEVNRLTKLPEFSSERIRKAVQFVIDEWNETPPILTKYYEETFPYRTTLLYGVVGFLFTGEAAFQERNHLAYQSGGLSIDDSNKAGAYMNFAQLFNTKYKELLERQKRYENVESGWGNIESGYITLPNF